MAIFKTGHEISLFKQAGGELRLEYPIDRLEEAKGQAVNIVKNFRLLPH